MNKTKKTPDSQSERIEITETRQPKKKIVHADPFARIQLHPLEELEARDNLTEDENQTTSLFDFNTDQVEPSKTNQVEPEPSRSKNNQVEPRPTKTSQVEPSRAKTKSVETSPSKNYTKVPNSIAKLAIPEKYFRGLSKHTYDILYQQTRGAIAPTRTIQLTKNDLVKLTGLAVHTVKLHIKYLNQSGLLVTHKIIGQHSGYIYEVFVPEEIETDQVEPSSTKSSQNLVSHTDQNLTLLGSTKIVENKDTYEFPKTSLNTNTNDDDALAGFTRRMDEVSRKLTKKGLAKDEKGKWEELADLLVMELEIAAARTKSVSSVPAFLTEHLRRRLHAKASSKTPQASSSVRRKSETIKEQSEVEEYFAEPLTEEGRQQVLKTITEYLKKGQTDFVMSLEETYTEADWQYLKSKIKE